MEVHSGCHEIWLVEYANFRAAETSVQVCGRLWEQLRSLHRSAGDFKTSWNLCTNSAEYLMPYSHTSGSESSTTTRYFIYHIFLCFSHQICYIIIWHVLPKSLYIIEYGDTGITKMDSVTGSIYLEDPGVDRHLIIRNTHSIFPSSWSHALLPSLHRSTQFVWFIMGIPSHALTLFQCSSSENHSFSQIPFGCRVRCGTVMIMSSLPSSSSVWPRCDRLNLGMHSGLLVSEFRNTLVGRDCSNLEAVTNRRLELHLEAVIELIWRWTWRARSCELEGH